MNGTINVIRGPRGYVAICSAPGAQAIRRGAFETAGEAIWAAVALNAELGGGYDIHVSLGACTERGVA